MATLTIPGNQAGDGGIVNLLDTDLNVNPYFDDFNATNQYYKVLFKPGSAVQVRELNQIQTILQNQIAAFGQNIFKEGSVIKGCSFTFDNNYAYVKLLDTYANTTALNVSDLKDLTVTNKNGLIATVVDTATGSVSDKVNLNTIYIKYKNSAKYANGSQQSTFDPGETLILSTTSGIPQGNVIAATFPNTTGIGYAFTTTEGIIFKKGYFIYVTPQTTIVSKYNNVPNNISVGFEAEESIITSNSDETLFDNAAGAPNYSAPGADRLKLEPILVARESNVSTAKTFFSLVDFKMGQPITIRNDTQFNSITKEEAKRTFETSGNYVIYPFDVSSKTIPDTTDPDYLTHFNTIVGKGIGYVEGFRVEFLNNSVIKTRRGTDYKNVNSQRVSLNLGYYAKVNEFAGTFGDANSIVKVELHNTALQSVSLLSFLPGSPPSPTTKIGTAYVRGFALSNGTQGTFDAQYNLYLFNIVPSKGYSFSDVKSIVYVDDGGSVNGVADVVLTYNGSNKNYYAAISNPDVNTMLFPFGQKSIKADGFENISFSYRLKSSTTFSAGPTTSSALINLDTDEFYYGSGYERTPLVLTSSQLNDLIVTPLTNAYSTNNSGTASYYKSKDVELQANSTGLINSKIKITGANVRFRSGDLVYYAVETNGVPINGLVGNTYYTVASVDGTGLTLNDRTTGANKILNETRTGAAPVHYLSLVGAGYVYTGTTQTSFASEYANGEFIVLDGSTTREIISIISESIIKVNSPFSSDQENKNHKKAFIAGNPIPFAGRTDRSISIDGTGKAMTIELGAVIDGSPFSASVESSIYKSNATPLSKRINKNVYVKIDCSTHNNKNIGPWCLGLPDVFKVEAVYVGKTADPYTEGLNYSSNFTLDNGQRDTHYSLAQLKLNQGSFGLEKNATLLVKLSVFDIPSSDGRAFFSANSYPIDDSNGANPPNAITTLQIPTYTTSTGTFYDLRDVIDFRPVADATASIATEIVYATPENPPNTLTFTDNTPFLPKPDSLFQSNIQYYLGRKDRVCLDINGNIVINEGLPGPNNPPPPPQQAKTMTLGIITIPPYPSLTSNEARGLNVYNNLIQVKTSQQRRYTMKDIGAIDNRIKNLEYYTSLSLLEQSASSLQVRNNDTGQNRFQNGIFVDGFDGFALSNTKHPKFYIGIDNDRTELRPAHVQLRSEFNVDIASSTNVVKAGKLYMLPFTSNNVYISQKYATSVRNCIEGNLFHYKGTIDLTPSYAPPDITKNKEITNNIDLASNWVYLAEKAWGTQYNNWETLSTEYADTLISASNAVDQTLGAGTAEGGAYGGTKTTTTTQTLQTTKSLMQAVGNKLSTSKIDTTTLDLGTFIASIDLKPFISSLTVEFKAHGLKPLTQVWPYFNETAVSAWCAKTKDGYDISDPIKNQLTDALGSDLITDKTGFIYGIFKIPGGVFQSGEVIFKLVDVKDLKLEADLITSEADGTFHGTSLSYAKGQSLLNTQSTVLSATEVKTQYTVNGLGLNTQVKDEIVFNPPPAPAGGGGGGCGCGCFIGSSLVTLASGERISIDKVKIGDKVFNFDKTKINTVKFVEILNDKYFEQLYSPSAEFAPFATVNHPLYIDGELHSVDPEKNYKSYPWLGKNKKINISSVENASNQLVYNLWLDGDGTYIINGFGTSSVIGDGGLLRNAIEQNLLSEEEAITIFYEYLSTETSTVYGIYLLNNLFGKLNNKYLNKLLVDIVIKKNFSKKILDSIFKLVGGTVCLVK